jgi:regulator of RNase E activity RraB
MFDKEMYKDTFSKLKASEDTLSEVMKMTTKKKRITAKTLLLAAVLSVMMATLAFAYGDTIIQFMFGDSSIRQVEKVGSDIAIAMEIVNRADYAWNHDREYSSVLFSTYNEANQSAPFVIKEPSYIPDNAALEKIAVPQFKDKTFGYDVRITYDVELTNGNGSIGLFQFYVGPDAYLNMQTVEGIQKVMVSEIEASVVHWGGWGVHLYWIKDEIVYELFSSSYGLDTLIAIAESI